jgi:hypothetical protein
VCGDVFVRKAKDMGRENRGDVYREFMFEDVLLACDL